MIVKRIKRREQAKFLPTLFLLLSLFSFQNIANAQMPDSIRHYLDTVITIAQKESFYTHNVNWKSLRKEMYAKAAEARKSSDLKSSFQLMLESLGDYHGGVYFADGAMAEYRLPKTRPGSPELDTIQAMLRKKAFRLTSRTIDQQWGYLLIPSIGGIGSEQLTRNARLIQDEVNKINAKGVKGWVIDLRYNPGGNIYAVATGMAAFIPEGAYLQYIKSNHQPAFRLQMESSNLYTQGFKPTSLEKIEHIIPESVPVMVLVSRFTSSAGEMLAYLLRQRKNCIIIGEETGGYCSGTTYLDLGNVGLNITTGYPIHPNGNIFSSLQPDLALQTKHSPANIEKDKLVQKAIAMLKAEIE
ncbi:S41 family peptidase [Cesiribacter sp. SM1]|uniref:S41 family peptidase n=1 Tax=Cesiribacter sp. SM1 TaxID=2861196 RepID=UPI001CD1DE33|nr:S41 family peptidase [Cesiribacter sp. SM1]